MLITNINNKYIENFVNNVGPVIARLYPELNNIDITITDDSNPDRTPYIGVERESPFVEMYDEKIYGILYNDIICINNLVKGLDEDAFHALIAHEIGHFVWLHRNIQGSDQEQEFFADKVAMSLNFNEALKSSLEHSKQCLMQSRDIFTDIFGNLDKSIKAYRIVGRTYNEDKLSVEFENVVIYSMNDITPLFFELIRVAIGNAVCLSHSPSAEEWQLLYEMAKKQSLIGICFAGVQRLQVQQQCPPEKLYLQWMGMAAKIQQRNEVLNRQCAELQAKLSDCGMRSAILKGQGIASLYAIKDEGLNINDLSGLRQSGDIDIWIEGGLDKALAWAKSQGVVENLNDHHFDLKLCDDSSKSTAKDIAIEVHYKPGTLLRRNKDKEYQKWIEQNASSQFDNTMTLSNGSVINAPTDAFNLIYMLAHMHRHLFSEGLGLRQLMDYYFLLQHALIDNSDWVEVCNVREIVRQESAKLGLDKFASGILWVLGQTFGLSMIQMPWTPNKKIGEFLLEEIMRGGNFGHHDETYRLSQGASHGRRLMEKAVNGLRFVKLFPKECVWSTLDYVDSFFYRYRQSKLETT